MRVGVGLGESVVLAVSVVVGVEEGVVLLEGVGVAVGETVVLGVTEGVPVGVSLPLRVAVGVRVGVREFEGVLERISPGSSEASALAEGRDEGVPRALTSALVEGRGEGVPRALATAEGEGGAGEGLLPPSPEGGPLRLPEGLPVLLVEPRAEAVREGVEDPEAQALAQKVGEREALGLRVPLLEELAVAQGEEEGLSVKDCVVDCVVDCVPVAQEKGLRVEDRVEAAWWTACQWRRGRPQ